MASIKDLFKRIAGMFNNKKRLPPAKEEVQIFSDKEVSAMAEEVIKDNKNSFKEELRKQAEVSKLDPSRYSSTNDMCMALLEDMGLSEKFKENPRAKDDLSNFVKDVVSEDKSLDSLIDVQGNLRITKEDDAKKIQQALLDKGIKIDSDVVKYRTDVKELSGFSQFLQAEYHEFRMNNTIYEKSNIYDLVAAGDDKVNVTTTKKSYSQDGIELEQEEVKYSIQDDNIKYPNTATKAQYESALINQMNVNTINPIDDSFYHSGADKNRAITKISRGKYLDEIIVQYQKGDVRRKLEVLNRVDKDLAELNFDPYYENALRSNNEDVLKALEEETGKRHIERENYVNNISVARKEIMEKVNNSKFKTGLMKMAEKMGIIDKENEVQQD